MTIKFLVVGAICVTAACGTLAQSPRLDGIAHVALRVRDIEKSRAFYANLGFQQAFQFDEGGRVTQSFIKVSDGQFIELYPRSQEGQSIGLMHVCYEAADIEAVRAAYQERGAAPTEVKKARAGNLLFVLHDPEGELVEYTQYLPGSLHSEDHGKHLGEHRLSDHLGSVTVPVKDVAAESKFYADKLGFVPASAGSTTQDLLVPGSNDSITLAKEPEQTTTQLLFTTVNRKQAKKLLRKAGLVGHEKHGAIVVDDPDGNDIMFRQQAKH